MMVRLRDLGEWAGGNTPSKANAGYWTNGTVPWVSPKDMKIDEIASSRDCVTESALADGRVSLVREGSVLFVTRSGILAHTFPVAITNLPVTINQDLKALTPKLGVSPKYVAHAVRGASRRILNECSKHGTTVASIDTNALLEFEIPMVDLDEQLRIVAEIEKQFSRLDEAVANLKRVKANLKRYKAAVLKAAVEGRLVPTEAELARREGRSYETGAQLLQRILETRRSQWKGRGKYKEPAAPDTTDLPELPEGWVWVTVAHLLCQPIINGLSIKGSDTPPGIAALKLNAMSDKGFDYEHIRYLPLTTDKVADILVREGDFFVSRGNGSLDLVGRGTIAQSSKFEVIFPDTMMRLRLQPVAIDTNWLPIIWPSRWIRQQIEQRVKTTAGIYKIAQPQMASIIVPLPPLAEQHRIVAEIDRLFTIIRELECTTEKEVCRAVVLKSAVMHAAFSLPAASNVGVD